MAHLQFVPIAHAASIGYVLPMQSARVVGPVVSTVKQYALSGVMLQGIQAIDAGSGRVSNAIIAVDRIDVGADNVLFFITSSEAALTLDQPFAAVDAGIVAGLDHVDVDGEPLLADQR